MIRRVHLLCCPFHAAHLQWVQLCDVCEQVAEELTAKDVIKAHARDELGIDLDEMSNPWQVSHK